MRNLSEQEIQCLERNGCRAQDWNLITVGENFSASKLYDVELIGTCRLGSNSDTVTMPSGVELPSGIRHARIINSTVGDNTLVENVAQYIANADIGTGCVVSNVALVQTSEGSTFGQGNTVSVLNEGGQGNVVLYTGLTSQIAALMALPPGLGESTDADDNTLEQRRLAKDAVRRMVMETLCSQMPQRTLIGDGSVICNTTEITNSWITPGTEVNGARRICECTLESLPDNNVFVGAGVILDGCVLTAGASVSNNVVAKNCFVGENSTLTDGFSATDSLFFANSFMANGEACAAFCGPFTVSHHKSTLLIGGMYSFYNAGSNTNFSNHAYKMGPIHYGIMERGAKTASGAHILWPARIGAFTMCMGKIATHPDTSALPFSYVIGDGKDTYVVPGRNIATVGTFRDICKWPKRDQRTESSRRSTVEYDWLSPCMAAKLVEAKLRLEDILDKQAGNDIMECDDGSLIRRSSLVKGIQLYTMAIKMFLAQWLTGVDENAPDDGDTPCNGSQTEHYCDLSGMMVGNADVENIVADILNGEIAGMDELQQRLDGCSFSGGRLEATSRRLALQIADAVYGWNSLDDDDRRELTAGCRQTRAQWLQMIKEDAEKEFELGDVDRDTLDDFIRKMDNEIIL